MSDPPPGTPPPAAPPGTPPPAAPPGTPPPAAPPTDADKAAELAKALETERRSHAATAKKLAALEQANLTEQEKAVQAAKEDGRREALAEAGKRLAAAEFRAAAVGKLADPAAALAVLDMARFVNDQGEPDTKAIADAVAGLAAVPPPPGRVPAGPRERNGKPDDWLRRAVSQQQR